MVPGSTTPPAGALALELDSVSKQYGANRAVDKLSLSLPVGEFLGLLGRNGAGKSTTIKLAVGLIRPDEGQVRVLGLPMPKQEVAVKRQIGVVGEDLGLIERLTGLQHLRFVGRMRGLPDDVIDARSRELFALLELDPAPGALVRDYSSGTRKKVALAAALLHGPRLLFLDEPFEGIDPVTAHTIRALLERLRARGMSMVLTSHVLGIVEKLCPIVVILERGRILRQGALDELRRGAGGGDLEDLFVALHGGARPGDLSWL